MKKVLLFALLFTGVSSLAVAQKKVSAVVNLTADITSDSLTIEKGKSFVVQLPVRNRAGDDWKLGVPVSKCNFTQSMLGQVGMLPNQPEPKLMFFKAVERGTETIHFEYKNPKAKEGDKPEERTLLVTIE
jgi:predicted secreted protein